MQENEGFFAYHLKYVKLTKDVGGYRKDIDRIVLIIGVDMESGISKFFYKSRILWLYVKYQLATKGMVALLLLPAFSYMLNYLIESSGRHNISSGDYIRFLLSFQGVGMLALSLLLLIILIGTDINAFIIVSALIREGRIDMHARHLLIVGIKSLKSFIKPSGIFIMIYVAIVIPIIGVGITISPMEGFQIPNFITEEIFSNTLYSCLYILLLAALIILSIKYTFLFHYVIIFGYTIGEAMKQASGLMKRHRSEFVKDFFVRALRIAILIILLILSLIAVLIIPAVTIPKSVVQSRIWTIFGVMLITEVLTFITVMSVPIIVSKLTELFYKYNEEEGRAVRMNMEVKASHPEDMSGMRLRKRTKIFLGVFISGVLMFNLSVAEYSGSMFDEIFRQSRNIEIIAHRAGGNLGAENTMEGLKAAIKAGAEWSEIDVQRSRDGHYVINHDATFKRMTGYDKSAKEMSLAQIKNLRIKSRCSPDREYQSVATLEEFMNEAGNKIGLMIELKGRTADTKMADDVIRMIKEKSMLKQTAILSLDYGLIEYIEDRYPEVQTGFLYFFSIGRTAKIKADILIMEEREAKAAKIDELKSAGKKTVVWTVNSGASIDKFVKSEVDGIITDRVVAVQKAMKRRDERSDLQIILDNFFR